MHQSIGAPFSVADPFSITLFGETLARHWDLWKRGMVIDLDSTHTKPYCFNRIGNAFWVVPGYFGGSSGASPGLASSLLSSASGGTINMWK